MTRSETINTFSEGLVMDLNPLTTPNTVLTSALNATLITFNGNEYVLQNDMGNGRVETAYLPEGYVPMGVAELGGIIYIVSYNPLTDKCQIGSFPSPERNITSSELQSPQISVDNSQFQQSDGKIINAVLKVKLLSDPTSENGLYKLNPGDKYVIYSTNNGISANKDQISDVGNEMHQIDTDPRNVTIHVISIGDDGKIVYLDDSLKWNDASGRPAHYYIKECQGESSVSTDIDSYRSLVSSAYNTFNSKVSGELALLLELKVIDSFSVTWDAEITNISGDFDKNAKIKFYVNYTSEHQQINPSYVILTDSTNEGDLQIPSNIAVGSNANISQETGGRLNDGTDDDIEIEVGDFKYKSDNNLSDYIWNYEVTPAMNFGYLEWLAIRGSINFSEIGSGKIEVDEWRYLIQKADTTEQQNVGNFYLNWGLSAYPEKNKKIEKVSFLFMPFDTPNLSSYIKTPDVVDYQPTNNFPTYEVTGKNSYSGYFQELINFGETDKVKNGSLQIDYLYLVDVCIQYGREGAWEYRHIYKWLYTTGQWNEEFVNEQILDFSTLPLDNVLSFEPSFTINDKIDQQTNSYDSNISIPNQFDQSKQPYECMGAMVTATNYNQETKSFDTQNESISAEVQTVIPTYPNLFFFQKTDQDSYSFSLESVQLDEGTIEPTVDRASGLSSYVIPKVSKSSTLPDNYGDIVGRVIEEGITGDTFEEANQFDETVVDVYAATLTPKDNEFSINVVGALFSRITADLSMQLKTIGQRILPFLYNSYSYQDLGMVGESSSNPRSLNHYMTERHWDQSGGGFEIELTLTGGGSGSFHKEYDSEGPNYTNWWDDPTYTEWINSQMVNNGGSFYIWQPLTNSDDVAQWGTQDKRGQFQLWVRTSEDHFIPIGQFNSTRANLETMIASLYNTLYKVDNNQTMIELATVTNTIYVTNYSVTLNINITSDITLSDIRNNIMLNGKTSDISIKTLYDLLHSIETQIDNPQVFDLTNITTGLPNSIQFPDKAITHVFYIRNINLPLVYEDGKSTSLPAIGFPAETLGWRKTTPKNEETVYVFNSQMNDWVKVTSGMNKYVAVSGEWEDEQPSELEPEATRRPFTPKNTVGYGKKLLDFMKVKDGNLVIDEGKLLQQSKVQYWFKTTAKGKGDPGLKIANNPNISFT